jgi:hypothetical protein
MTPEHRENRKRQQRAFFARQNRLDLLTQKNNIAEQFRDNSAKAELNADDLNLIEVELASRVKA